MLAESKADHLASLVFDANRTKLSCQGVWTTTHLAGLISRGFSLDNLTAKTIAIDGQKLEQLDSAGAWFLHRLAQQLQKRGVQVQWLNFSANHQTLLNLVGSQKEKIADVPTTPPTYNGFYRLGKKTVERLGYAREFLTFIGEVSVTFFYSLCQPRRIQWRSLLNTIDEAGYRALPIIALLLFLIGIVLAYQMGQQLKMYGANIYIVDITGLAMLQEFSPLITAIIIAGRSGSAITAQIGTMKINQEVDALMTMGLSPVERLILPKIFGLIIALPLLVVWADIFGVMGTMVMAQHTLNINYHDFLHRFQETVSIRTFLKGLSKAPVFAAIITNIGCFQGLEVSYSADSLGRQTTKSVVQSIFLIIIADAIFSIIYSWKL